MPSEAEAEAGAVGLGRRRATDQHVNDLDQALGARQQVSGILGGLDDTCLRRRTTAQCLDELHDGFRRDGVPLPAPDTAQDVLNNLFANQTPPAERVGNQPISRRGGEHD